MAGDKLTRKDFASDDIFKIGEEYAVSLQPAINASQKWLSVLKDTIKEFDSISAKSKEISSIDDANKIKRESINLAKEEAQLREAETKARLAAVRLINAESTARKKANKDLTEEEKLEKNLLKSKQNLKNANSQAYVQTIKNRKALTDYNRTIRESTGEQRKLTVRVYEFFKTLVAFDLARRAVDKFFNAFKSGFESLKVLDSIRLQFKFIIKDGQEVSETMAFLTRISNAYGAELLTLSNRYIKFRAAALQSNLTMTETQGIFESVTKASGVLGLKNDELRGIFLALEQMISKGKVTTEELRRQLGERLPGAFGIMAESMGVSIVELDKMLKKGEVLSAEVLPEFARQLEKTYGIENVKKVDTLVAATVRMDNAFTTMVQSFEGGSGILSKTLIAMYDIGAAIATSLGDAALTQDELIERDSLLAFNKGMSEAQKFIDDFIKGGVDVNDIWGIAFDNTTRSMNKWQEELIGVEEELDKIRAGDSYKSESFFEGEQLRLLKRIAKEQGLLKKIGELLRGGDDKEAPEIEEEDDKLRNQRLKDAFDFEKSLLKQKIRINEDIISSDKSSITDKLNANKDYVENAQKLAELESDFAISNAQGRADKIKQIEVKKEEDIAKISKKQSGNQEKIFSDRFKQILEEVKAEKAIKEEAKSTELADLNTRFEAEIKLAEDSDAEKLRLIEKHEQDKLAIKKKYAKAEIDAQIAKVEALLETEGLGTDETESLQKTLNALRLAGYEIDVDNYKKSAEEKAKAEKEFNEFVTHQVQFAAGIISDVWDINGQVLEDFFSRMIDFATNGIDSVEDVLAAMVTTAQLVREVGNAVFDERIDRIDEEIDASNEKYDSEIEQMDLLTDKENETEIEKLAREKRERALEAEKRKEEQRLEKEKRKLQTKQAEFNKAIAINTALINVALGITSALTTTPPASFVMAALVGALGAVQVAAIAAKPIPKYKMGKERSDRYTGSALLNDGGKTEYKETLEGNIYKIQGRNVVGHVDKDDIIHKDFNAMVDYHSNDDMIKQAYTASMLTSLQIDKNELSKRQAESVFAQNLSNEQFKRDIKESLKGLKVHNHINNEGLAEAIADELDSRSTWGKMN